MGMKYWMVLLGAVEQSMRLFEHSQRISKLDHGLLPHILKTATRIYY